MKKLTAAQREQLLREIWLDHDGRWFLKVAERYGFEVANEINRAAGRSVARKAMQRLMAELRADGVKDLARLRDLFEIAYELFHPPPRCDVSFVCEGTTRIRAIYRKCPVMERIELGGGMANYVCGCPSAFEGWLAAVQLPGSVRIVQSVPEGAGECEVWIDLEGPLRAGS